MSNIIGDAVVRVRPDSAGFAGQVESGVSSPLRGVLKIAGAIAVAGAVTGFLKSAVGGAMAFEAAMAQVNSTLENSGQGTPKAERMAENYTKALADLGSFSRQEVAAGLNRAELGTQNLGKAMQVETVAANLSRRTHMDLSRTTLLVTKAWEGNTTGLKRLGINFVPVTAAADALKTKIAQLTKEHDGETGAAKKHTEELIKAAKGQMDNAKATDKANTILAVQKRLTDISKNGMKDFADTTAGKMAQAEHSIDNLKDEIGKALLPAVGYAAQGVTAAIDYLNEKWPAMKKGALDAIKPLEPAFRAIRDAVGQVADFVKRAVDRFMEMQGHSDAIKAALATLVIAISGVTIAVTLMNAAMLLNPFVLLVVAIAVLVGSLVFAYEHFKTFRDIVNTVFDFLKTVIPPAIDIAKNAILTLISASKSVADAIGPVWRTIYAFVSQAMADIKAIVQAVWPALSAIINAGKAIIVAVFSAVWTPFKTIVQGAFEVIRLQLATALNIIADVIRAFSDILHGRWGAAWGELKNMVSDAIHGAVAILKTTLSTAATAAGQLAKGIANAIWVGIKSLAGLLGQLASVITSGLEDAIGRVIAYAGDLAVRIGESIVDGIIAGLKSLPSRLGSALASAAHSAVSYGLKAIQGGSPSMLFADTIGLSIGQGVVVGAGKGAEPLGAILSLAARRALDGMTLEVKTGGGKVTDAMKQQVDHITAQVKGISDRITAEAAKIRTAFESMAAIAFGAFDARTQQILDKNTAKWDTWAKGIADIGKAAADSMTHSLDVALDLNTNRLNDAVTAIDNVLRDKLQAISDTQKAATPAEAALSTLQSGHDQAGRDANLAKGQADLALAQKKRDRDGMVAAQKEIDDAIYAQTIFDLQAKATAERGIADTQAATDTAAAQKTHDDDVAATQAYYQKQADDLTAYWNDQIAKNQASLDRQLAQGQAQQKQEQIDISSQRAYKKGVLTGEVADLEEQLAKHPGKWREIHTKIMRLFRDDFGPDYQTAGKNLGVAFAQGLGDANDEIAKASNALATTVAKHLKTSSPTELGPMSDLDTWWTALPDTLISGLDMRKMGRVVGDIAAPAFATQAGSVPPTWDEGAFIEKLAAAIGREVADQVRADTHVGAAVSDNSAATAAALARAAIR